MNQYFEPTLKKNIAKINRIQNHQQIQLNKSKLKTQLAERVEARVWEFSFEDEEIDDKTLKELTETIKPSKGMRKLRIECEKKRKISDVGLRFIGENIKRMSCLKSVSLSFQSYYR